MYLNDRSQFKPRTISAASGPLILPRRQSFSSLYSRPPSLLDKYSIFLCSLMKLSVPLPQPPSEQMALLHT